jgi:hypothetical protein
MMQEQTLNYSVIFKMLLYFSPSSFNYVLLGLDKNDV